MDKVVKTENVSVVVVGMEYSKTYGSCPGSAYDSKRMYDVLSKYSDDIVLLQNHDATIDKFRAAISKAIQSDLAIIYYSGHGGNKRFSDTGPEETDGKDEFLCLYDGAFRDNEIWSFVQNAKGRVFLVFDCCHSETMFREAGFTMSMVNDLVLPQGSTVNMLCWSGCADNTYSYGSSTGGELTNAILRHKEKDSTYTSLWDAVVKDKKLKQYQTPKRTQIGSGFAGEVFR